MPASVKKIQDNLNKTYQYIKSYCDSWGYPPSVLEIQQAINICQSTAYRYLDTLEAQGKIECQWGKEHRLKRSWKPVDSVLPIVVHSSICMLCDKSHYAKGYCFYHYHRLWKETRKINGQIPSP